MKIHVPFFVILWNRIHENVIDFMIIGKSDFRITNMKWKSDYESDMSGQQPVGPTTCGPVGPTTCGPVGPTTCGPVGPTTCGPVGPTTCGPVGPTTCGPVGPTTCGPVGPTTCGPVGPTTCRPVGPTTCRPVGPTTCRPVGPTTCRPVGPTTCRPVGPTTCRPVGPTTCGTCGTNDLWDLQTCGTCRPVGPADLWDLWDLQTCGTCRPAGPVGPVGPAGPAGPVGPVGTCRTCGPVGPMTCQTNDLSDQWPVRPMTCQTNDLDPSSLPPFWNGISHDVLCLIQPGVWMGSVDLKHAYYSMQVNPLYKMFSTCYWQRRFYEYNCMPNGYAQAPLLFMKILKQPSAVTRKQGLLFVIYLDDAYLQGDSYSDWHYIITTTTSLFTALGFEVNFEKSVTATDWLLPHMQNLLEDILRDGHWKSSDDFTTFYYREILNALPNFRLMLCSFLF